LMKKAEVMFCFFYGSVFQSFFAGATANCRLPLSDKFSQNVQNSLL